MIKRSSRKANQGELLRVAEVDNVFRFLPLRGNELKAKKRPAVSSIEVCAGAGGQALGIEQAGFGHEALVEIDPHACATLRLNRPYWNVMKFDLRAFPGSSFKGIDLLAGGVPCPPFSIAGKKLGADDERNLFPEAIRLVDETRPKAVMLENVRGLLDPSFDEYRAFISESIRKMGYRTGWQLVNASDFGVPQLRPRVIFVAVRTEYADDFSWPLSVDIPTPTVGQTLIDLMAEAGWERAAQWAKMANGIAPTIVGGSSKHGGPDLGPTRAKRAWAALGVDGMGIADEPPKRKFTGMPRLTNRMVARLQGFPDEWVFAGKKTNVYRQIGNAFPPPVARAVAIRICQAITMPKSVQVA